MKNTFNMTPEKLIREASLDDINMLSGLIRESNLDVANQFGLTPDNCPKHPSNCTDEWIENDLARGVNYYILENDIMAMGCAGLEKANSDLFYLERLSVLPEARRNGFGKALVNRVISDAKVYGAQKLGIGIIANHTKLKIWYQKIGFIEGETKKFEHLPFLVMFMTYNL